MPPRVLACVLCQQRKVRCDRQNPCANCIKAQSECVPATLQPRRRRRRFPESELLERLRRYEDLLRQSGVSVESFIHPTGLKSSATQSPHDGQDGSDSEADYEKVRKRSTASASLDKASPDKPSPGGTENSAGSKKTTLWRAITDEFKANNGSETDSDAFEETTISRAWDQMYENNDHVMFGAGNDPKNITLLHPDPVHIFRLWHVYMDNVNPILKITHSPTLQQRIIEASSNLGNISPALEALMFGIYSVAMLTIIDEECIPIFGEQQDTLIQRYRSGCQQALINAGFLRTTDLQVVTAYLLYLISIRPLLDPRSLSTMSGMTVRIAQRMGLHSEAHNKEFPVFEAEMRRRVWWQIVLFDARIGEMAASKDLIINPSWDCNLPLNVNDSDLYPHLKDPPTPREGATECLFVLLSCELANWIRNSPLFLDYLSPFLKSLARPREPEEPKTLDEIEKSLQVKYLKYCDLQIPLHYMASCMFPALVGKWRVGESVVRANPNDAPSVSRPKATDNAVRMIELDSMMRSSSLTKGYLWYSNYHFPFPAYVFLVQQLRRSTMGPLVDRAWEAIEINFRERNLEAQPKRSKLTQIVMGMMVKSWDARAVAFARMEGGPIMLTEPAFITRIRQSIGKEKKVDEQLQGLTITAPPVGLSQTFPLGVDPSLFGPGGQMIDFGDLEMNMDMGGMAGDMDFWNMDLNMMGNVGPQSFGHESW